MKILATCATGGIGRFVVPALVAAGHDVHLLTRNPDKVASVSPDAVAVVGEMTDHTLMERTLAEFDALVLIGTGEFELIGNLYTVEAAQHSERLSHIVFIGGQSLEAMRTVPTVAPKLVTEWALAEGRKPYTSLRPSTFMQNDLMMRPLITQGRYIGGFGDVGVARLDLRDLADAVVACLGTPATFGQTYTACGPDNLTTAAIVQAWSTALGRPVEPLAMSPAAFPALPPSGAAAGRLDESPAGAQILHHSLELQFMAYRRGALLATAAEVERFAALIGQPPRTFADCTRETSEAWSKS